MTKAAAVLVVLALTAAVPRAQSPTRTLRSFYFGTGAGFGIWSDDIVTVEPVGQDARVRAMRLVSVNEICPDIRVVQAAERFVPRTTVQAVANLPICDITQQRIDRASRGQKHHLSTTSITWAAV